MPVAERTNPVVEGERSSSVRQGEYPPAEDRRFLKARFNARWRRSQGLVIGSISAMTCLIMWQLVSRLGFVDRTFLSSPTEVLREGYRLLFVTGTIYHDIAVSSEEVGIGLGAALILGIILGLISGRVRWFRQALEPIIVVGNTVPPIAFLPLFIIWFGLGLLPKVLLIFNGCIFIMILNTEAGVRHTDPRLLETARSFRASKLAIMTKVVFPSAVPSIMTGIRLSIGRSLLMMVVAELYAANAGLGFFIVNAGTTFATTDVFVGVAILAIFGIVLNSLARSLESHFESWKVEG
jgi:NitT/TauT family transport system permease protein